MLILKSLHIIFVVMWFAGLLYLPRLFVYHTSTTDAAGQARFKVMEKKLFVITSIGGIGALIFGSALIMPYIDHVWLHLKLVLVAMLVAFHCHCYKLMRDFRLDINKMSEKALRLYNEIPAILLIAIVFLVVMKPFI